MRSGARLTGTLTFLFTDVEGSTRLLQRFPETYGTIVETQRRLIRAACSAHDGVEFGTEGDAVFVAFTGAPAAVAAAIEAQRALASADWPSDAVVRVRMALHTGDVQVVDDDYVGLALHVTARLCSAAHGGQVLLSAATQQLAPDAPVVDLGAHRLRDVVEPVGVFMATDPALPIDFPPPRTLTALPNNLPHATDEFVGRREELVAVTDAVGDHRLVTILGPGGMGKTRLAIETAAAVLPAYRDGVWLVELATATSPDQIGSLIASLLRIGERSDEPIDETVVRELRERETLLVIDNCEHLVDAVAQFVDVALRRCPGLHLLTTSRELLGVPGEHAFVLPPLDDATDLFLVRARAVQPAFAPGPRELEVVAGICARVDRLPLAIELAAARLRILSLDQIAARLDDRFRLLAGGARTATPRQRTLEAVVAWSYDLLAPDERSLFRRFSVLAGSFDLETAAALAGPDAATDVLDGITSLVDKSLVDVLPAEDGYRYAMLETLRHYGRDRLAEEGEVEESDDRLVAWAGRWAERIERDMRTPAQDAHLRAAMREQANLRLAFECAREIGQEVTALRIVSAAPILFEGERRAAIHALLDGAEDLPTMVEAHAYATVANLALAQADWRAVGSAAERATVLFEAAGDRRLATWARYFRLHGLWGDDDESVGAEAAELVARFRTLDDDFGLAYALWAASQTCSDPDLGDRWAEEAERMFRTLGSPIGLAHDIEGRALLAIRRGDVGCATPFLAEALDAFAAASTPGCTAHTIEAVAAVLVLADDPAEAAVLLGAAAELRQLSGQGHRPWEREARRVTEQALAGLDFDAARSEGRSLSFPEAVARTRAALDRLRARTIV